MGVVCIPCKTYYCKTDNKFPYHPIINEMGMSQDRLEFMCIDFNISSVDLSDVENEQDNCYVGGNEQL